MKPKPTQLRFGLRTLLALVFGVAVLAAFPSAPCALIWQVWITGPLIALVFFLLIRNATRSANVRWPQRSAYVGVALAFVPLFCCLFTRHRWVSVFHDDRWPRRFPYPDAYLTHIHDWWDRLHPAVPGSIKIHGEYFAVLFGVNCFVVLAFGFVGAVAGYVFRDGDFLAASRRLTWFLR
jgi:hypothetical protein